MRRKKVLALLTALTLCVGGSINVCAADLVNSIPSISTDLTQGQDITQGKTTQYDEQTMSDTTYEGTMTADVYATRESSYTIKFPVNIILDESGSGEYVVGVKGDISGNQKISITPPKTFLLEEVNAGILQKPVVNATVDQPESDFTQSKINSNDFTYYKGTITADITSGSYHGQLPLSVSVTN